MKEYNILNLKKKKTHISACIPMGLSVKWMKWKIDINISVTSDIYCSNIMWVPRCINQGLVLQTG